MSQENVEIVRAAYEAWNAGDMGALRELYDPDAIMRAPEDRVVVRVAWHGAGHDHESSMEFTLVLTVRKGKVYFVEYFWDHADALEAAGLQE